MTAADARIAQQAADLREQLDVLGQVDPADVRRFLDLVESTLARTGELPAVGHLPMPRGGRSTAPPAGPVRPRLAVVPTVAEPPGCGAIRPRFTGALACVCTEARGHEPADHVARDRSGRELARWPCTPERPA